ATTPWCCDGAGAVLRAHHVLSTLAPAARTLRHIAPRGCPQGPRHRLQVQRLHRVLRREHRRRHTRHPPRSWWISHHISAAVKTHCVGSGRRLAAEHNRVVAHALKVAEAKPRTGRGPLLSRGHHGPRNVTTTHATARCPPTHRARHERPLQR